MGKILSFWAQQSWNFWNRTWISKIMSIWNFDVFQEDWTKDFLEFCCWNFNWVSLLYLWIFSFSISQEGGRLHAEQNNTKFFTGYLWTLVNRCYKATCFSCAFKHDNILNTYNSNSGTSIDFNFLCTGWCYEDSTVSWSPMLGGIRLVKWSCIASCNCK